MDFEYLPRSAGTIPEYLRSEGLTAALAKTTSIYKIAEGIDTLAWVGVMQETLLSENAYLWAVLDRTAYTLYELRQAKELFTRFVGTFDAVVWAEADRHSPTDNKFLLFMGFYLVEKTEDRCIYKWGTH